MIGIRRFAVLCLLLCVFGVGVYAQAVNANLTGTITDSSGATVPNAKVSLLETNTGVSRSATTNESGNYLFPNLPPGTYTVTVERTGFKKIARTGVDVQVDTSPRVDLMLQPGSITETIEVTGAPPILQTDTATTASQIATVLTENVPLVTNRNFQSLLNLAPGVAPVAEQHSQFFNASSSLQTEVNGQAREGNNTMIEGTDDNERTGLLQIYIPPIEAIQTVDVSLTNHDPEMGRATGAVVNVVLKSGTNEIHGAAYEFLQNSDFNARSFFNPSVGHLAYNYVGGNLGGPIKKNKMFIFGDYLRVMDHEANTNLVTIPPDTWRTGDLSEAAKQSTTRPPATRTARGGRPSPATHPAYRINPVSAAFSGWCRRRTNPSILPSPPTTISRCCRSKRPPTRSMRNSITT